jgi:hypothetical protein
MLPAESKSQREQKLTVMESRKDVLWKKISGDKISLF